MDSQPVLYSVSFLLSLDLLCGEKAPRAVDTHNVRFLLSLDLLHLLGQPVELLGSVLSIVS